MSNPLHVWMPTIRGYSGGDVFVERLADGLRRRGVKVSVEWFDRRYEVAPGLLAAHQAPADVDIIHTNGLNGYAFRGHGLPLVVTEHHYVLDPGYRPYKSFAQELYHRMVTGRASLRSLRAATVVTTHSQFVAKTVKVAYPEADVSVIPLWVDLDRFSPVANKLQEEPRFRFLFVGNSSRRKGFDVVIELARRMRDNVEIVCTGGLRGRSAANLPANVHFRGRLTTEELVEAYRECDAALVPSRYEGFGYAALEAMACGKPVLGFACGSVEEIVEDGESGFLLPVDDIAGLERRARDLAADPTRRVTMGLAGRARAEQGFDVKRGIDAYMAVYEKVRAV